MKLNLSTATDSKNNHAEVWQDDNHGFWHWTAIRSDGSGAAGDWAPTERKVKSEAAGALYKFRNFDNEKVRFKKRKVVKP